MKADRDISILCGNALRRVVALLLITTFFWQGMAQAMSLATQPLATQSSAVPPNLIFVLDDSGSMDWEYIPDYVNDGSSSSGGFCRNSSGNYVVACQLGDPPFMSADFNHMYYDPSVLYAVPINADQTSKTVMNAANTSNWTAVPNDAYGVQATGTKNLVTNYPDRVWGGAVNTGSINAYLYPDSTHTGVATVNGSPYYFKIHPGLYCKEPALKNCISATSPSGLYTYPAKQVWCDTTGLTNCQGKKTSTYKYVKYPTAGPAPAHGSLTIGASSGTVAVGISSVKVGATELLTSTVTAANGTGSTANQSALAAALAANINANHTVSGYSATNSGSSVIITKDALVADTSAVTATSTTAAVPGTAASGTLTIGDSGSTVSVGISSVKAGATELLTSTITAAGGTNASANRTALASAIASNITAHHLVSGYSATSSAEVVTITKDAVGADTSAITATSTTGTGSNATGSVTYSTVNSGSTTTSIKAGSDSGCTAGPAVTLMSTTVTAVTGAPASSCSGSPSTGTQRRYNMANSVFEANAGTATATAANTAGWRDSYTSCTDTVGYTAPAGAGYNNWYLCVAKSGTITATPTRLTLPAYTIPVTTTAMSGGTAASTTSIPVTTTAMSGYTANANPFERVDIVSTNDSYPKAATRTDCAGATCTYAEEMTNFANWYAYYRTRMQMMKSSSSLAFRDVDEKYRVGYFTINTNNGSGDNLDIAKFDSTQKGLWYSKLFAANPNNSTPLREAVTKAGRIYGGKLPSGFSDPIQFSCQQNFTILSTDGYWNGTSGYKMNGTSAMDNQDGQLSRPYFDGTTTAVTDSTPTTTVVRNQTVTSTRTTTPYTRTKKTTTATSGSGVGCSSGKYKTTTTTQTYNRIVDSTTTTVDDVTTTVTHVVVTTNNVVTSDTTNTSTTSANVSSNVVTNADNGAPSASTTWADGSSTTSCSSSPTPSAGNTTYSPALGTAGTPSTSTTGGPVVTVLSTTGPTTGSTATTTNTSGGTSNTLADVAAYFYNHDLRCPSTGTGACDTAYNFSNATNTLGADISTNNVADPNDPNANWQHMTLFTLGLGIDGLMNFSPAYPTESSGDYHDVAQGTTANSSTGVCSWLSTGATCNWPIPAADSQSAVDDLWHAAVNGHGTYFSASNPTTVSAALGNALAVVARATGSSAASATSSPNINSHDNFIFSSTYRTVSWDGELQAQTIDPATGLIGVARIDSVTGQSYQDTTPIWQVSTVLEDAVKYPKAAGFVGTATDSRFIFTLDTSGYTSSPSTYPSDTTVPRCNHCKPFSWSSLSTAEKAFFSSKGSLLSQYATLPTSPTDEKAIVDSGANLVNYLRGQSQYQAVFRSREHVLGDTVNSVPAYVKTPQFNYDHDNYGVFKSNNLTRKGMLYIGANDGMLHAINTDTYVDTSGSSVFLDPEGVSASRFVVGGQELWAYVPHMVMSNMFALADANYANNHQYYVDGSPQTIDVYDSAASAWKTILVSGLGRGGKGYFALDVTNPANPKGMWEFCNDSTLCTSSDSHVGYSYGAPVITKLADGTPVVLVTSGYENDNGQSYLYVLNAITGAVLQTVPVNGSGDALASPGGLAKIRPFIADADHDNTAIYVYGGDLKGRLWKFTLPTTATSTAPGIAAPLLLATFTDGTNPQPISTRPEVGVVKMATGDSRIVVFVGTGKYIETTDPTTTQTQSVYALVDNNAAYTDPRAQLSERTISATGSTAGIATTSGSLTSISSGSTDFTNIWNPSTNFGGWFADLPNSGERVNLDPQLIFGTLVMASNVPDPTTSCGGSGGSSWLYQFRADTGLAVKPDSQTTSPFGQRQAGITVGVVIFTLESGKVEAVVTNASGIKTTKGIDTSTGGPSKRGAWREILE